MAHPPSGRPWVTVVEYARPVSARPFLITDVEALMGHLDQWQPQGLWGPFRYAIELTMPARRPDEALQWTLGLHRRAAHDVGLGRETLVRAEVFSVDDPAWSPQDCGSTSSAVKGAPAESGMVCDALYTATRGLLAATSRADITNAVAHFIAALGGHLEIGAPRLRPGMTDIDLRLGDATRRSASVDALSVGGLLLERLLPVLLDDARLALARLQVLPSQDKGSASTIAPGRTS